MKRSPLHAPATLFAGLLVSMGAQAAQPSKPARECASLVGEVYYNVTVTAAEHVPAANGIPAFCRVRGHEPGTDHDLEVRLPDQWQGRYVQRGGGGFDGSIPPLPMSATALRLGAVQGVNNGGHRDPTGAVLVDNPRGVERYAHVAIMIATRFGKAVTQAYYGQSPHHSYYEGCSNGGRGALNAAAKYGSEFDGVIAVAPTFNLSGQIAAWTQLAALSLPSAEQFGRIHAAAVARCDLQDGLKDGVVSNWQRCDFDPGRDVPRDVGLTAEQVAAARALMRDLQGADGTVLYSGFGVGDMAPGAPAFSAFGTGQMRHIVYNDLNWSPAGFSLEKDLPAIRKVVDDQYQFSASVSGLVQFMRDGGKVLVWHGSDDALLSHKDTIRTWADVTRAAGPELARDASRLYIAPGVAHCAGGPGADSIESLSAMIDWVEQGKAPGTLLATKRDPRSGAAAFTRPLCEHPAWPRYRGRGDPDKAESFECVAD